MKTKLRYYVVDFITDYYFRDDERAIILAENEKEAEREIEKLFGEHLIVATVRKATFQEKHYAKKYKPHSTIISLC